MNDNSEYEKSERLKMVIILLGFLAILWIAGYSPNCAPGWIESHQNKEKAK